MSTSPQSIRLLAVEIRSEQDVVVARQRARQLAAALGFPLQAQTSIATALSEIARNAFQYAGSGRVEYSALTEPHPADPRRQRQTMVLEVRDHGPGIANLETILAGQYRSQSGMGIGILGTRRLMDRVDIDSSAGGTLMTLRKVLPPTATVRTPRELQKIAEDLAALTPPTPLEEVQVQNKELLQAIEEAKERQEELSRVNQELAETNTGVMALYDELETLHRVSIMLASKVDLKSLIQTIIDVTTSLTDAELGVFFTRDDDRGVWHVFATSGPLNGDVTILEPHYKGDFFGADFAGSGMINVPDLPEHEGECPCKQLAAALADQLKARSCLSIPVVDSEEVLQGALVFISTKPRIFTERSERILTSIASQAAVGIQKARLFQTVTAASAAKDDFLAMLSHELRTPLNPVMAIVSSLYADPKVPEELREDIAVIWRNVRLEARLIDDLLDFNKLIKGKLQLSREPLDAHALIESVIEICREELEAKNHRLRASLNAARRTVLGDAARLQQVLWNVLKNAIKFTPEGGSISVVTSLQEDTLRIEITDTGRGIDPSAIDHIFTAFEQGQPQVAAHFGGLGLGLSIARMFVNLHAGKIAASSPGLEQGATITIELPVISGVAATQAAQVAPVVPNPSVPSSGCILLVDDHADTLDNLARLLKRRGFEVLTAGSGAEARSAAQVKKVDLYISDLGLPDCNGHELLAELRAIHDAPAIALSGYGMESDVAESKNAGFQEHLIKPVDFGELTRTIAALLRR